MFQKVVTVIAFVIYRMVGIIVGKICLYVLSILCSLRDAYKWTLGRVFGPTAKKVLLVFVTAVAGAFAIEVLRRRNKIKKKYKKTLSGLRKEKNKPGPNHLLEYKKKMGHDSLAKYIITAMMFITKALALSGGVVGVILGVYDFSKMVQELSVIGRFASFIVSLFSDGEKLTERYKKQKKKAKARKVASSSSEEDEVFSVPRSVRKKPKKKSVPRFASQSRSKGQASSSAACDDSSVFDQINDDAFEDFRRAVEDETDALNREIAAKWAANQVSKHQDIKKRKEDSSPPPDWPKQSKDKAKDPGFVFSRNRSKALDTTDETAPAWDPNGVRILTNKHFCIAVALLHNDAAMDDKELAAKLWAAFSEKCEAFYGEPIHETWADAEYAFFTHYEPFPKSFLARLDALVKTSPFKYTPPHYEPPKEEEEDIFEEPEIVEVLDDLEDRAPKIYVKMVKGEFVKVFEMVKELVVRLKEVLIKNKGLFSTMLVLLQVILILAAVFLYIWETGYIVMRRRALNKAIHKEAILEARGKNKGAGRGALRARVRAGKKNTGKNKAPRAKRVNPNTGRSEYAWFDQNDNTWVFGEGDDEYRMIASWNDICDFGATDYAYDGTPRWLNDDQDDDSFVDNDGDYDASVYDDKYESKDGKKKNKSENGKKKSSVAPKKVPEGDTPKEKVDEPKDTKKKVDVKKKKVKVVSKSPSGPKTTKKRGKNCSYCGSTSHLVRKCYKKRRDIRANRTEANFPLCTRCNRTGHTVEQCWAGLVCPGCNKKSCDRYLCRMTTLKKIAAEPPRGEKGKEKETVVGKIPDTCSTCGRKHFKQCWLTTACPGCDKITCMSLECRSSKVKERQESVHPSTPVYKNLDADRQFIIQNFDFHENDWYNVSQGFFLSNHCVTAAHSFEDRHLSGKSEGLYRIRMNNGNTVPIDLSTVKVGPKEGTKWADIAIWPKPNVPGAKSYRSSAATFSGARSVTLGNGFIAQFYPKYNWQYRTNNIDLFGISRATNPYASHNGTTVDGSSGAPIFDRDNNVIGVHVAGMVQGETTNKFSPFTEEILHFL